MMMREILICFFDVYIPPRPANEFDDRECLMTISAKRGASMGISKKLCQYRIPDHWRLYEKGGICMLLLY